MKALLDQGEEPVVLDVRTSSVRQRDPRRIPSAIVTTGDDILERLQDIEPSREIILYCT